MGIVLEIGEGRGKGDYLYESILHYRRSTDPAAKDHRTIKGKHYDIGGGGGILCISSIPTRGACTQSSFLPARRAEISRDDISVGDGHASGNDETRYHKTYQDQIRSHGASASHHEIMP